MNCTARYATRSAGKWSASRNTAAAVAKLDMLASLALVAERNHYVRPKINEKGVINIRDGRHPVVERMIPNDMFIANDTYLDDKKDRISIITGPNMAGKSTYMRQSALIVLMAQVGSFVPASAADIGIVDRIFTRVGASDDLASGQSTFMVEMTEVANILRNATRHSLLILGRDRAGHEHLRRLSIAWAVVEHISNTKLLGAKTLFATHYHELTELGGQDRQRPQLLHRREGEGGRHRLPPQDRAGRRGQKLRYPGGEAGRRAGACIERAKEICGGALLRRYHHAGQGHCFRWERDEEEGEEVR